jgi:hypothetical protein
VARQAQQAPAQRGTTSGVLGGGRSRGGKPPRSPRRGSPRIFQLEEFVEEVEAIVLPQAATTKITGDGRRDQAAAAIQLSPESSRGERGE